MTPVPDWVASVLAGHTARAWEALGAILPSHAYLGGGTAIATHLQHRISRDLDVLFEEEPDLDALERALQERGPTVTTRKGDGTLDCLFGDTKVQLLDAARHNLIEPAEPVAGIRVAGLGDLLAMKLRAITDRGEHRDYLDLATIENDGGRRVEEGLAYFVARFEPNNPDEAVSTVLRSLAYLGDIEDDPALAVSVDELQHYWASRIPQISTHAGRFGYEHRESLADAGSDELTLAQVSALQRFPAAPPIGPHLPVSGKCKARTRKQRRCPFDALQAMGVCGIHRVAQRRSR
ncbi:MAG: nucleotidyl transferase AbiEii/AbiGii toxin family protein [Acidimicrobiales bacterium]